MGGDISSNDAHIKPTTVSDKTVGNYIKREVKVKPTLNLLDNGIYMELWLNINELGEELSKSDNFMYTLTTSSTSNMEGVVVSGNFKDKQVGDKITLIDKKKYLESTTETYYLWIWLDSMETNIATAGQTFNLSLGGICSEIERTYANLGGENELFKADEYREKITKIEFVEGINIPEEAITFELGESPSKTTDVIGWLISNGTDTYTLKIGSNGKIYAKSLAYAFNNMINVKEIFFDNLDTSETINMYATFNGCNSLTSIDLSNFNTSKVLTMQSLFNQCKSLTSIDVSNFDTSNVINMWGVFAECTNLTSLDLSKWKTSKVTNMQGMFYYCNNLTSLNIKNFDTSMVENMSYMFINCNKLTILDVSSFNTSKVLTMQDMFALCDGLTTLDLSSFNTAKVENMFAMFYECTNLTNIYVSNLWNTSVVINSEAMLYNCTKLPNYNSSVVDKTNAHYNSGGYLTYKAI